MVVPPRHMLVRTGRRGVFGALLVALALLAAGCGPAAMSHPAVRAPSGPTSAPRVMAGPRVIAAPRIVAAPRTTPWAPVARPSQAAGPATAAPPPPPPTIRGQLITVTAPYGSASATLQVYALIGSSWIEEFGPWSAWVGYNGIAAPGAKVEGDGKTPSGTYPFSFFFGVQPNPGVSFAYRQVYSYDYWDDDPQSPLYNEWVDNRTQNPGASPEPMDNVPSYNYGAVIAYNTARTPGLGSGIFLHVSTGQSTFGCISLPQDELLTVLRWLNPADNPQIRITGS